MKSVKAYEGAIKRVRRDLERGECHPSWGKKLVSKLENIHDKKEKAISKKRK
jgi:hypothetical protein